MGGGRVTGGGADRGRTVGTVERLWRYPVKGLLGEELDRAEVTGRGLAGDRERALLDLATGRVASAKLPRLWAGLLGYTARTTADGGVAVTGPDGRGADERELSAALGREVALIGERPPGAAVERAVPEEVLARGIAAETAFTVNELGRAAPDGGFFDFAPLHLVTTSTLRAVGSEAERYRPNLVVRTEGEGYIENAWVGRELTVGPGLRLRILAPTPRCAVPTLRHGPLPRRPEALRVPAERNRLVPLEGMPALPCVGVYARVLVPGAVRAGDRLVLD
ncbi:MOSC domain-containing protein [Kitasatospora sp. NPDC002543]